MLLRRGQEIQQKHDNKLNAVAIKKHFVKTSDPTLFSRQIALLLHVKCGQPERVYHRCSIFTLVMCAYTCRKTAMGARSTRC